MGSGGHELLGWFGGLSEQALLLRLVELVLLVSLLELLWLLLRAGPALRRQLLPNLLAGLSLSLALRLALGEAGLAWIAACLAAAGIAHLQDLRVRRIIFSPKPHPPTHAARPGRHTP